MRKSYIAAIALCCLAIIVSWPLHFRALVQKDTVSIHDFPLQIGTWAGEEIPISDEEYEILETRNAFTRIYRNEDGSEIMLFLNYSQTNRKAAHPPEICYIGGGATFTTRYPMKIDVGQKEPLIANKVLIDFPHYQQAMFYWFQAGDSYTPSYWNQQVSVAWRSLMGKPASSALLRVTSTVEDDDVARSDRMIVRFIQDAYPHFLKYMP